MGLLIPVKELCSRKYLYFAYHDDGHSKLGHGVMLEKTGDSGFIRLHTARLYELSINNTPSEAVA